jgi:hypothetical protein
MQKLIFTDGMRRRWLSILLAAFMLSGFTISCTPVVHQGEGPSGQEKRIRPSGRQEAVWSIFRQVDEGQIHDAEKSVNQLLIKDLGNPYLHLLNGLIYYRQFLEGDRSRADQAETGFILARQFDPGLSQASYLLGLLYMDLSRFEKARIHLLEAATSLRSSPEVSLALAYAAYYARDIPLAVWAVDTFLTLRPGDRHGLMAGTVIFAAAGDEARSQSSLSELEKSGVVRDMPHLVQRAKDWLALNRAAALSPSSESSVKSMMPPAEASQRNVSPGAMAPSWSDCSQSLQAGPGNATTGYGNASGSYGYSSGGGYGYISYGSAGGDEMAMVPALPSPCAGLPLPRMAILDVVIVRTEEISGFSHGLNLLDGLSMVLGYNWSETKTSGTAGDNVTRTLTRTAGLPAAGLAYSLNIFTTGGSRADVLARPSLLALDRVGSTFFSGSVITVALTGQYSNNLQDKSIGIGLSATPTFIDDETMLLAVKTTRSFIMPVQMSGLGETITTSKNAVTANVRIKFGETMILSGLKEREVYSDEIGVPALKSIPIVKYLFSRNVEDDFMKNVLILITPRKPERLEEPVKGTGIDSDELQRIGERGTVPPYVSAGLQRITQKYENNLHAVIANLGHHKYIQEFRIGDLGRNRYQSEGFFQEILHDLSDELFLDRAALCQDESKATAP